MFDFLAIRFDDPAWLLLLVLIIPCYLIARRSVGGTSRLKATFTFALRMIIILLLAGTLAHPIWEKRGQGLTVTLLLDRSQSIPLPLKAEALKYLQDAVALKENRDDRVAVVTIAKEASIAAMPDPLSEVTAGQEEGDLTASNLASGVRMGLALAPDDTANRFVLASDGNETEDSVIAAAQVAQANGIPIDVLVLEYQHTNEILFEGLIAPARARKGQSANLKMVVRSLNAATGRITLRMNELPLDLNGDAAGDAMQVSLEPGTNVFPLTVSLDDVGPQQFSAVLEPDDPASDVVDRNNTGVAVTFVTGEGRVLVVDDGATESEHLVRALSEASIQTDVVGPAALTGGLVLLAGYDAVILANIPRWAMDDQQVRDLHSYVHDLGGGFMMLGGPESFGAGAWIDSDVAKVLPVDLDPPQTRQMPRGALALVMHSCEMAQGNYWGQKVAIAAIEALSRLDYVGIVVFDWAAAGMGSSWAFKMQLAGDKSAAINAAKKMNVGDMPDFGASMTLAYNGLTDASIRAGQKHAIVISDGDPAAPSAALMQKYLDAKITITTVMVAGHGTPSDNAKMSKMASDTGGNFYNVSNPNKLPAIFIKEAQLVSRSLIQDGQTFPATVASRLPGPTEGYSQVPAVEGYVLTAPREGLAQTPLVVATTEGNDPLFAYWNYGLGRSIAYTSDLHGRWGGRWASWSEFRAFWEQAIRWVMRPSSPQNMAVTTMLEGDHATVEVEALGADSSFLNFLQTSALVIAPNASAKPLSLQQTGPGRYHGEFPVSDAGAYLVNINYSSGAADTPGNQGNLQAAVTVPYSREFRAVRDNRALLEDLAARTNGRVLDPADPSLANLFDRESLEVPRSPRPVWDLLAIIAAGLLVMDVAARRLAMDLKGISNWMARISGRRGEAGADTVSAWKKARAGVGHRRQSVAADAEPPAARSTRFTATEQDISKAIDVESQTDLGGQPAESFSATRETMPKPADATEDEDYTSRLLAAKRRARGPQSPDDKSGGTGASGTSGSNP